MLPKIAHPTLSITAVITAFYLFLSPYQAGAATQTFTASVASTVTDWSRDISITRFDPGLGTLTSIEITLTGGGITTLTVSNAPEASSNAAGSVTTQLQLSLFDNSGLFAASGQTPQISASIPESPAEFDVSPGDSLELGPYTRALPSSVTVYTLNDNPAILSEFSGAGNIVLTGSTFTETVFTISSGNADTTQATEANLGVSVVYHYQAAIPEPGVTALLVLGAGSIWFFRSRRRASWIASGVPLAGKV